MEAQPVWTGETDVFQGIFLSEKILQLLVRQDIWGSLEMAFVRSTHPADRHHLQGQPGRAAGALVHASLWITKVSFHVCLLIKSYYYRGGWYARTLPEQDCTKIWPWVVVLPKHEGVTSGVPASDQG